MQRCEHSLRNKVRSLESSPSLRQEFSEMTGKKRKGRMSQGQKSKGNRQREVGKSQVKMALRGRAATFVLCGAGTAVVGVSAPSQAQFPAFIMKLSLDLLLADP